ncbi:MAG: hypothetical protein M3Q32_07875, partial [Pseudomonadota bacterium]|nr:hypothetical protein [Pseudomonadota bacterium]
RNFTSPRRRRRGFDDAGGAKRPQAPARYLLREAKGAVILPILTPNGKTWCHQSGNIGLAISGSGDTLAGIIAGLAARGATLEQAGAWGVALHALAGEKLATRFGPLGYLASELAAEVPALMHKLSVNWTGSPI